MTPDHSKFPANEEDCFLDGCRMLSAHEKVGSSYLKKEFRRDFRKFLEAFVNCVLSTVAASEVYDRPEVELLQPFYTSWWRRSCPNATVRHFPGRTARKRMDGERRDGGLQIGVPVVCARAEVAGADFN